MRLSFFASVFTGLCLLASASAQTATTATVSGIITDPQGRGSARLRMVNNLPCRVEITNESC